MISTSIRFAFLLSFLFVSAATRAQTPLPIASDEGTLSFERSDLSFAPQSTGIQNCVNIGLNNTTDRPRLLTQLRSLDPKHFTITSPAAEMLPLTIGANTTFYINLCFKADEVKTYSSELLAIFQGDTVRLKLNGRGVAPPEVLPVPTETSITEVRHKGHQWIFQFGLKTRTTVRLVLEDMLGKVVRNFPFQEVKTPGYYEVSFDEKSDIGKKLAKGTYILRLEAIDSQAHTSVHSSKMITIK